MNRQKTINAGDIVIYTPDPRKPGQLATVTAVTEDDEMNDLYSIRIHGSRRTATATEEQLQPVLL